MIRAAASLIAFLLTTPVGSEAVEVRHRGAVDLVTFECRDINRSSLIQRVCYDQAQRYLIVGIRGNYEDFCELSPQAYAGFMTAPSMGRFFNDNIRARGDRYGCGSHRDADD